MGSWQVNFPVSFGTAHYGLSGFSHDLVNCRHFTTVIKLFNKMLVCQSVRGPKPVPVTLIGDFSKLTVQEIAYS